jgi:glycosyltransferase involved in cell wall biosynthesis
MPRLLYLSPGLTPPPDQVELDKFYYLSEVLEGDVLTPVWWKDEAEAKNKIGNRFPKSKVRRFCHHLYLSYSVAKPLQDLGQLLFYIRKGLALHRAHRYDYIMSYGTSLTGIAGLFLKVFTGAHYIAELPNTPHDQYRFTEPVFTVKLKLARIAADILLHVSVLGADAVKLLYPQQLGQYVFLKRKRHVVVHDLVPVRQMAALTAEMASTNGNASRSRTVLILGHPWFTKGMDVAVRAFRKVSPDFPDYRLLVVGHIPDRRPLEELAAGCAAIEFRPAVKPPEALRLIADCSVYVSASRTEGIARVLLEAMAAARPVIASAVGGTPHLIVDGYSGLLFARDDANALADQLRKVLADPALATRLGAAAQERVLNHFDERAYVRGFSELQRMLS